MDDPISEATDAIRQHYNSFPYPGGEKPADYGFGQRFIHYTTTARQRVWRDAGSPPTPEVILDAGCGTGHKTVLLSKCNPASIVWGVDLSESAICIARSLAISPCTEPRVRFECLKIEELHTLNVAFDYINADEILYLSPDPVSTLRVLGRLLKPRGIIRANLHCAFQRSPFLRLQRCFRILGLMATPITQLEARRALNFLGSLRRDVPMKSVLRFARKGHETRFAVQNCLLPGDKGFEIAEVFDILKCAGLRLMSMVQWKEWELQSLFADNVGLDPVIVEALENLSMQTQLTLIQLLRGDTRLLDFWAVNQTDCEADRSTSAAHTQVFPADSLLTLHPLAQTAAVKTLLESVVWNNRSIPLPLLWPAQTYRESAIVDTITASLLLHLSKTPLTVREFTDAFSKLKYPQYALGDRCSPESMRGCAAEVLQILQGVGLVSVSPNRPA